MIKSVELENKSIVSIHGLKPGGKIKVAVDVNGTPLDKNWRRRMKDNDGAIVANNKSVAVSKKKATKKKEA